MNGSPVFFILLLLLPVWAEACTCGDGPLSNRYEKASVVLVARVGKRLDHVDPDEEPPFEWEFEALEVFKGDVTFDTLIPDSCTGDMFEEKDYLIFTNDDGLVGTCTAGALDTNNRFRADLEVLRKFRDGELDTLSEPWVNEE